MRSFLFRSVILTSVIFAVACAPSVHQSSLVSNSTTSSGDNNSASTNPTPTTPPDLTLGGICSALNFSDVQWPAVMTSQDHGTFALAANITGSFEGTSGWGNISNNFDGQGMSLGLNQQNFGQGSLQPLLIDALKNNMPTVKPLFSPANLSSLIQMLNNYVQTPVLGIASVASDDELFPNKVALSKLDEGYEENQIRQFSAQTDASVAWAKANLFLSNGTTFKSDWKTSFVTMATTAMYRSIQIKAALSIFTKAKSYFKTFKLHELRSLLLMYDIVVQNGGFNSDHLAAITAFYNANPNATETARLNKILEIRAATVRTQYRADVIARKSAIINGTGVVHGSNRNLPKQYCYTQTATL